jgi:biotin carboxylase
VAHLLVVESWVGAMSRLLPRAIRESGHEFTFLTRDLHHYLRAWRGPGTHPLLDSRHVLRAETNDVDGVVAFAERAHELLGFDGVLTSCDYYLDTAATLAARLGLPGAKPEAVRVARRKDLARQAMQRAGLPSPAYAVAEDWAHTARAAASIGYPLVVKPVDLSAGMFVRRVDNEAELMVAVTALEGFAHNARHQVRVPVVLLEEFLAGPEVSVETATVDGLTTVIGVTDKSVAGEPAFIEMGHAFPAPIEPDAAASAADLAVRALAALGFDHGVAHVEVKLTLAGPYIVEVNLRPAGNSITELVRQVTGIDLPVVQVVLALGGQPELSPRQTGAGGAAIRMIVPDRTGRVSRVLGADTLAAAGDVVEWHLDDLAGRQVSAAADNNAYVGRVMVTAADPVTAAARASQLTDAITLVYDDAC